MQNLNDRTTWKNRLSEEFETEKIGIRWIHDYNLWKFFVNEAKMDKSLRISESTGRGIY